MLSCDYCKNKDILCIHCDEGSHYMINEELVKNIISGNEELEKENEGLKEEIRELREEVKELKEENEDLREEIDNEIDPEVDLV